MSITAPPAAKLNKCIKKADETVSSAFASYDHKEGVFMGMTEAILFGMLSLSVAVAAVAVLRKIPFISVLAGAVTIVFVYLSAYHWRFALIDSGKNTAWLGAERYPLVLVVYIVLFGIGCVCILGGTVRYAKKQLDKRKVK